MVDCTYLVRVLKLRNLRQLPRARLLGWLRESGLGAFSHACGAWEATSGLPEPRR